MPMAKKRESSERGHSENVAPSEAITWIGSSSNKSIGLEQSPEQVKLYQEFRDHFEAFYRG